VGLAVTHVTTQPPSNGRLLLTRTSPSLSPRSRAVVRWAGGEWRRRRGRCSPVREPFLRAPFFDPFIVKVIGYSGGLFALLGLSAIALRLVVAPPCHFPPPNPARIVRSAVIDYQLAAGSAQTCPTLRDLVAHGNVEPNFTDNYAQEAFSISCSGEQVSIVWAGPDRAVGTSDDRQAPCTASPAQCRD
jgi:hypothetical protein